MHLTVTYQTTQTALRKHQKKERKFRKVT